MSARGDQDPPPGLASRVPPSGFDALLAQLDADPILAEAAFAQLRRALVRFFDWRGVGVPEDAADETIDRIARRLTEGLEVQDITDYALGIARLVLRETWRTRRFETLGDSGALQVAARPEPERAEEPEVATQLDRCLAELPESSRTLVLDYYAGAPGRDKIESRRALAQTHGLTDNALRSRVQRLRDRLEECVRTQLRAAGRPPSGGG